MTWSGPHVGDDALHVARHRHGVPQQVVASRLRLEGERLDGTAAGRVEEAPERVVLALGLVLGADDTRIGAPAQPQVDALEAEVAHDRGRRRPRRHDDALARVLPRRAQRRERIEV